MYEQRSSTVYNDVTYRVYGLHTPPHSTHKYGEYTLQYFQRIYL